ncbi:MAG: FadR family transcriptional regulator [Deltaproteobacteria bacterium]|nr:FadR family transcriptional regulator [Deltaproteobacteria bacterium]
MKRVSLVDSIVEEIKNKIISGEFKDGDMLESQDMLAKSMSISRPSLREALRRLQLMGLIDFKHGRGTFVKTLQPKDYMSPISAFLPVDKKSAYELLEARLYIEGSVAALAAQKATESNIQQLEDVLKKMILAGENLNVEEFVRLDVKFHVLIAHGCGNRILFQVVDILRGLLHKLITRVFDTNRDKLNMTFSHTLEYHSQILESIKSRNGSKARKIMEKHIKDVQKKLEKSGDFVLTPPENGATTHNPEND